MPRLPPALFWRARREVSPLAAQLLPACRDLQSAANELRWIREHVRATPSPVPEGLRVWQLVERRGRGIPLQYVLGTQPFGDLEIKCRPGVLIPRHETEAYTLYLASLLAKEQPAAGSSSSSSSSTLSILDLCTGTGCIPLLLLQALLRRPPSPRPSHITVHGIDISPRAIRLARANLAHNTALRLLPPPSPPSASASPSPSYSATFTRASIFSPTLLPTLQSLSPGGWDVLTANPPYISPEGFARSTARAVRNHEPRLALVPPPAEPPPLLRQEDTFYARLLHMAQHLRPKRVVLEVGGWAQAVRVVRMALRGYAGGGGGEIARLYPTVEIWRDEPAGVAGDGTGDREGGGEVVEVAGREVRVRGVGDGRVVYLCR
ncbi:uncharacterized protein THITE_2039596 [Thermothielavioides terrestris NRRL 8126]|uniref:Methyltransferase domain-containing protein n=1 Tax=Thermothielavioides terrestris (strain ATCC 38088 / NRRL 8126) TaxID=578455 RepID=G2QQS3_THETT|nr:uncharacterized protein THITE_2039596 [Thermothielavioides terrestris NRRL 8126]AEO63283.1 hypothetical protein THITE_2039596 [Thermothielavioides terrestris NRRL 8126]